MGDERTRVNFGGMDAGTQNFMQAHKALNDTLDDLEQNLQTKLANWDGAAQQEYQRAKAEWRSAANHMATVIQSLGNVIGTGGENYGNAEKSGVNMWST